jgi:hypothetical protein
MPWKDPYRAWDVIIGLVGRLVEWLGMSGLRIP